MKSPTNYANNMKDKRSLSPEEKKLWRMITRGDKKLHRNVEEEEQEPDTVVQKSAKSYMPPTAKELQKIAVSQKKRKTPAFGSYADIDKNTAGNFRNGDFTIDATLDLHGYTINQAHEMLDTFIRGHYRRGARCLLVITGKGLRSEGKTQVTLKNMLPAWLSSPDYSEILLVFDTARPKHGGQGAYYLLLRRNRISTR